MPENNDEGYLDIMLDTDPGEHKKCDRKEEESWIFPAPETEGQALLYYPFRRRKTGKGSGTF